MSDIAVIYVDVYKSKWNRQWRWRARNTGNRKIVATSGESFHNRQDCYTSIDQVFSPETTVFRWEAEHGNQTIRYSTKITRQ